MSMTLRLDTAGLRSLIEENPEFKIDLQKSVMDNINKDNMDDAIRNRLETVLRSMGTGGNFYNRKITLTDPVLIEAMNSIVKTQVEKLSDEMVANIVNDKIQQRLIHVQSELRSTIKETMISVLTTEMAKEILLAKLV